MDDHFDYMKKIFNSDEENTSEEVKEETTEVVEEQSEEIADDNDTSEEETENTEDIVQDNDTEEVIKEEPEEILSNDDKKEDAKEGEEEFFEQRVHICPKCGVENRIENVYCRNCGEYLSGDESQTKSGNKEKTGEKIMDKEMYKCPICGTENDVKESEFCVRCGAFIPHQISDENAGELVSHIFAVILKLILFVGVPVYLIYQGFYNPLQIIDNVEVPVLYERLYAAILSSDVYLAWMLGLIIFGMLVVLMWILVSYLEGINSKLVQQNKKIEHLMKIIKKD